MSRTATPFSRVFGVHSETYHHRRSAKLGFLAAAAAAAALAVLRLRPFRVAVEGSSMEPALLPGEWAVAVRPRPGSLRRGQVVVARPPGRPGLEVVKRLAAGPGDAVPDGRGLGPGEWYLLGDRPDASTDSRQFGPVPEKAIVGRVRLVYWPPGRARLLWGRWRLRPTGAGNSLRWDRPRR